MAKLKKPSPGTKTKAMTKKDMKFPKKGKSSSDVEAFESETVEGAQNEVDPREISDLVKKLGLDKFHNISTPSKSVQESSRSPKEKGFVGPAKDKEGKSRKPKVKVNKLSETSEVSSPNSRDPPTAVRTARGGKKKKKSGQKNKTEQPVNTPPKKLVMLVQPGGKWFEDIEIDIKLTEEEKTSSELVQDEKPLRKEDIGNLRNKANHLLEADIMAYKSSNLKTGKKSDYEWMEKIMKSGTLPDRMAAFIVRIQDSPIHNLNYLQHLISMVKVQGKQQCIMTADTVRDLFLEDLLPPNRKLVGFEYRGAELRTASNKQLIQWIFEDQLKSHYYSYIEALRKMSGDTVEKLRGKAISIVYQMLVAHPELESVLLQILVNKLGDPAKKLGSRALFYLKKLLDEHPKMKLVVIEEVERLLFRNNIAQKAQYYGICFLNLIRLDGEHASLAHKLISVYLAFFKACVKTGDIDTKMMSGLLTGINKAFPQAREYGFQFSESLDTLYKIVQLSQFTIGVQALCILFQIINVETNPSGADRFFRVLYGKMLAPEFLTTSHNMQFLNLIFKAMKTDNNINRVIGLTKRLLQICQNVPANLACAILFLISEVSKVHPGIVKVGEQSAEEKDEAAKAEEVIDGSESENDDENEESGSSKQNGGRSLDLQLLMKSSNIRISTDEIMTHSDSTHIETSALPHKSKRPLNSTNKHTSVVDLTIPEEDNKEITATVLKNTNEDEVKPVVKREVTEYSALARNPSFCGAEFTLSHELVSLTKHFHPSVALFAQTLINRKTITYDGNPLKDFTLSRFLERFVYRNAKVKKDRPAYQPQGLRNVPVNSENYIQTAEDKIPVEEKFFYKFFKKTKKDEIKTIKADKDEDEDLSDVESVDDDEFDDIMGNYFKSGKSAESSDDDDDVEEGGIDFAAGVSIQKKSKKRKHEQESESEGEEDDDDELENDSAGDEDADDFIDMDEQDEGDLEGSEDDAGMFEDDEEDEMFIPSKKTSKRRGKGTDMFAPAEQFAEMLEANAEESLAGSQTLINKDRADPKQLKWEVERDRWVKGYTGGSKAQYKGNKKKKMKRK